MSITGIPKRIFAIALATMLMCMLLVVFSAPQKALASDAGLTAGAVSSDSGPTVFSQSSKAKYKGHYYEIFTGEYSWSQAKKACEKRGGHLATITSSGEQAFIDQMNTYNHSLWIGGYRNSSNKWRWITGEKWKYTNWRSGEPNNSSNVISNENRVAVWPNEWNDLNGESSEQSGYVCEWDYTLKLSSSTLCLNKGDKPYVTYSVTNADGDAISAKATWSSSNKSVAKVSSKGRIVAIGTGVCKITCKAKGVKRTVKVVVKPVKVKGVKAISKSRNYIQLKWAKQSVKTFQVYMYDRDIDEYALVKTVKGAYNTAMIQSLSRNTTYKFKIRGVVKSGRNYYGAFSKVFSARTTK